MSHGVIRSGKRRPVPALAAAVLLGATTAATAETPLPDVSELPIVKEFPDPLVMFDGSRVTTPEEWFQKRRPELKKLFQHYMYGYVPAAPENVQFAVARVDRSFFGGKATKKEVTIQFGPPGTPAIYLLLVIPNQRPAPAPVFLALNPCGNHTVVADPGVAVSQSWAAASCPGCKDNRPTEAGRGTSATQWAVENTIDRGYALATFHESDVDPDKHDFSDGVHPHFRKSGQNGQGPYDWGTIAAWAWGLSRAVDYLLTDKDIDHARICVTGHSRRGKTALLAGAMDERIALVVPHQAGCGGTAPSRNPGGETVKQINDRFPHWFNDTFPKFNLQVERLPFDQHALMALVAPRPLLLTNAVQDQWADPEGQFQALQAADRVYRFLGAEGLEAKHMLPPGKLIASNLGYYIRPGVHSLTKDDWNTFMDFADKRFAAKR